MSEFHRVYAKINLKNIYDNIAFVKKRYPSSMVMPIIKADGYGHGAVEIAKAVEDISDYFGIATVEEGIELRSFGIDKKILVLGTVAKAYFEKALKYNLILPVYTLPMAAELSEFCERIGKKADVHLVVDSGMGRIGMRPCDESVDVAEQIAKFPGLNVCGIFSHFACADEEDKDYSHRQYNSFRLFCDKLVSRGIDIGCRHIANSAAILDLPEFSLDMVRAGIMIYGLAPSDEVGSMENLKPALELKSHITHIKQISAGDGVSYGITYKAPDSRTIATVSAGYADGVPRLLSNKGRVIVRGKYAPIAGRVCMDQFMIDITDIPEADIDDTVTIIGSDGDAFISCEEVASIAQTINYEIVCDINKRVKRIYTK